MSIESGSTESRSPDPVALAVESAESALQGLATVDAASVDPLDLGDLLVRAEAMIDALTGTVADWTRLFTDQDGPRQAGSPGLAAWSRQHLRLTPADAAQRLKTGRALAVLPKTRRALREGRINYRHATAVATAVKLLGSDVVGEFEDVLLDVAYRCDATAVREAVVKLRDLLGPDAADAEYVKNLDRRDVTVAQTIGGFEIRGFVDPETGTMVKQVLYAGAKPVATGDGEPDDVRTSGQRRVDALRDIFRAQLDHGLPTDRGIRPHLFVTVTLDQLHAITQTAANAGLPAKAIKGVVDPATLDGYGPITSTLAARLACDCQITPVIVDRPGAYPNVLDVGRTRRLATLKQRAAIRIRQGGQCANPGCHNTHLEIHHYVPWSAGGTTDLAVLGGYCTRCHHLIHAGLLVVKRSRDGTWSHRDVRGRKLADHRRTVEEANHDYLAGLSDSWPASRRGTVRDDGGIDPNPATGGGDGIGGDGISDHQPAAGIPMSTRSCREALFTACMDRFGPEPSPSKRWHRTADLHTRTALRGRTRDGRQTCIPATITYHPRAGPDPP